ncbi:metalloprotease PmbA [Methyloversatilis sp.]|uniref:metalloprotease PmbA n=1 Tax=Methyloversatilis sp. TaxID=2569862 RepID=UPI0027332402|nr:metalloprotease PmbA [Methyloversatilis sp.]MDP2870213.1 metalloprotease PmbA [Methyloversatilis sp.]MDP3456327.1 metalloprotease PmbA [Methyloversatilis sp.]MDP3579461.1 metalloprotease PmbA [Methyloversatilis sp.]
MSRQGFSYTDDSLRDIAQDLLDHARAGGATAAEVDVSEGFGQSVTVRRGEVETIEYNRDKGIGVTVYVGQRKGYASSSDFSRDALRASVDAALSIARFTAEDDCAGLPDKSLLATEFRDLDLFHPWELPVEQAIEIAKRCEDAAFATSPDIRNSEGGSVSAQQSQFISANSLGFMAGYSSSRQYITCSVIAGEGDAMQREDWYASQRSAADLPLPEAIGRYAAERALARLGARRVKTTRVPVLFEAPLAIGLIGHFVQAASGGSLYRKSSFLLDSLGKQIFSPLISIAERPHLPRAMGSGMFDDDGVVTCDRDVVQDGVLNGYFLSTYSARKLGMQTTGNAGGSHNLIVKPGTRSLVDMIGSIKRGLLVTELLGHGVNYVTGDYSRGAAGYWIENGQIAYPVQEITIAGNLRDMYMGIKEVGADTLVRGSKQCGSILIDRMRIAGA